MPIALRSASRTSAIILGRDHQSRMPSRTRATYSFIDQPRAEATFFTQSVSLHDSRKETIAFSSVTGFLGTFAFVWWCVIQVNSMKHPMQNLETGMGTRLGRWVDRSVSSRSDEAADEGSFEATAGSAPPNRTLGPSSRLRLQTRAAACAPSRPPTPNDWIG